MQLISQDRIEVHLQDHIEFIGRVFDALLADDYPDDDDAWISLRSYMDKLIAIEPHLMELQLRLDEWKAREPERISEALREAEADRREYRRIAL